MKQKLNLKKVRLKTTLLAILSVIFFSQSFAQRVLDDLERVQSINLSTNVSGNYYYSTSNPASLGILGGYRDVTIQYETLEPSQSSASAGASSGSFFAATNSKSKIKSVGLTYDGSSTTLNATNGLGVGGVDMSGSGTFEATVDMQGLVSGNQFKVTFVVYSSPTNFSTATNVYYMQSPQQVVSLNRTDLVTAAAALGPVDFTKVTAIQVYFDVDQYAMDYDVSNLKVPSPSKPMPVVFGEQQAKIEQGKLLVNWSTLTEKNNDRFVVEASKDGKNFVGIDSIKTKALHGNSSTELLYSYQKGLENAVSNLGLGIGGVLVYIILALALFLFAFSNTNKINRRKLGSVIIAIVLSSTVIITGCKKDSGEISDNDINKIFIRITQVDVDGTRVSGKVVQAVKE